MSGSWRMTDRFEWRGNLAKANGSILSMGTSDRKLNVLAASRPVIQNYVENKATSGTVDIWKLDYTHNAATTSGYVKGLRVTMNSEYKTPGSFNAIKGIIDYGTTGYPHGDCAALSAELTIMNGIVPRGAHYCVEAQVSLGSDTDNFGSCGPFAFHRCKLNGTKAQWDAYGGLFNIEGFTEGNGLFLDNAATPAEADGGIRFFINGAVRYLLYANDAEN